MTDSVRKQFAPAHGVGSSGFSYIGLLIFIAILGLATTLTVQVSAIAQQRASEEELLFIGRQFATAFRSYFDATPAGQRPFPAKLEDLLKDPRYPGVRRHLRRLYVDPITGKEEWGTVAAPGGGFMGVRSLSDREPLKVAEFDPAFAVLTGKMKYSEWAFGYAPPGVVPPGTVTLAGTPAPAVVAAQKPPAQPPGTSPTPASPAPTPSPAPTSSPAPTPTLRSPGQAPDPPLPAPRPDAPAPVSVEISASSQATLGGSLDVQLGIPAGTTARRAQIIMAFDATALQVEEGARGSPGRAVVELSGGAPGNALGVVSVQFRVIASQPRSVSISFSVQAFDETGAGLSVIPAAPVTVQLQP